MKTLLRITFIAFIGLFLTGITSAQCPNSNTQFGTSSVSSWVQGTLNTLTTCLYGGEYRLMTDLQAGSTYSFETCGDSDFDTQITVYDNASGALIAYNDDFCGLQSSVTFTSTGSDVRVLINRYNCTNQSSCMTLSGTLISGATSTNPCDETISIVCGQAVSFSVDGAGTWNNLGGPWSTPGAEQVFSFTAVDAGLHTVDVTHSGGYYIDLYSKSGACSSSGWTYVDDILSAATNTFTLAAGETILLLLDDENTTLSSGLISVTCPLATVDPCLAITDMDCDNPYSWTSGGTGAWNPPGPWGTPGSENVFTYTPTQTGDYVLSVTNTGYYVDVFVASSCSENAGWTYIDDVFSSANITVALDAGVTYYFLIDDEDLNASSGTISVSCPCTPPPGGIDGSYTYNGDFVVSSTTDGACNDCNLRSSQDRVYEVVLECEGSYTFSTCGASWDTYLYLTTEPCGGTTIALNDDACGLQSSITASLQPGTYYINVEAFSSFSFGDFDLAVSAALTAPTVACQDAIVNLDANGSASIEISDIDGGSDLTCLTNSISASQTDFDCDDLGTVVVTLTVSNDAGTNECDATVTVNDLINPTVDCQDIVLELDDLGLGSISDSDIVTASDDNCAIASTELSQTDFDCSSVGDQIVTVTVSDAAGNSASCQSTIDVQDNIAPLVTCPNVEINLAPGLCGQIVQYSIETSDNCGVDSEVLIEGPATETYLDYHDSPWSVTWDVTDVNGNLSSCTFAITMNEFANPTETLTCNDLVLVALDEDGCSTIGADMILEGGPYGCYDDYIVDIDFAGNEVCCETIGETLIVIVTDPDTGNSCDGEIQTYDALVPYCSNVNDYAVACTSSVPSADDATDPNYPQFYDNCEVDVINLISETVLVDDICSNSGILIERIWSATDASGNTSVENCTQLITIEREEVFFSDDSEWDCASYSIDDLHPDNTGYPTAVTSAACGYNFTFVDQILPGCGSLEKIIRTWTVLDWCTGQLISLDSDGNDNVEILKLMDYNGPQIDGDDLILSTSTTDCASTSFIALPEISDDCNDIDAIHMFIFGLAELEYVYDANGSIVGGHIPAPGLPVSDQEFELLVTATDACGNYTEEFYYLTIVDDVSPTVVCDEITQVALGTDGTATVFAGTFDDGSHDNCCLEDLDVRRMDGGEFGESVSFDCTDTDQNIMVALRVHDCYGNNNTCMVQVLVEDKIAPFLIVPEDTEISCDDYYTNVAPHLENGDGSILEALFGTSSSGDNCEVIEEYSYTFGVDQCGEGSIVRTWTVDDPSGNGPVSGSQTISIFHVSDWSISFPGDLDATCVDGTLPDFGYPTVSDDECEMIAISYTDTQFDVVPDACYKIVREWSAINWCTYPTESAQTATQVIKVTDNEAPIFNVDDFTVEITEADCDTPVTLPTPDVTDCSDDITIETSSDLPSGEVGPGTYIANYTVSDGCGNYSYDVITITVVDAKKPTPYVTDHLVTEIMQTGMTGFINVNDYDIGSFDNCSDVVLSFSPDITDTDRQFTCDELGLNTLEIWVTDEAGNQDFVTVTMEVQDNMNACGPGSLVVAGALTTQDGAGIDAAMVDVNSGEFTQTTTGDGLFSFNLPSGGDYSIVPSLDMDADNGVTTFDIVLITQHILGVNTFTSPYNYIAADANNSQTVTTLDLVAIRKVILQLEDGFPNNTSWRFVDADHVFADATDPWGYPEVINYNNLDTEELETDFIGIKIGDVNGSVQSNMNASAEARSGDRISLSATDASLRTGEETIVSLSLNEMLSGIQFTLVHEGLSFKGVEGGLCGLDQLGQHDGHLTLSWNDSEVRLLDGVDLIQLRFEAIRDMDLSQGLYINSTKTKSEAYTANGIAEIDLIFEGQSDNSTILYDNVPNPFKAETVISFSLAEAGKVSISITDLNGKIIRVISGDYSAGYNSIELRDLKATGVLYYQLETDGFIATKKMVKI